MRTKILALGLLAAVAASLMVGPSSAAPKKKKPKTPKTLVVGTDPAGDWGAAVEPQAAPIGDGAGQDVVKATITKKDAKTLNFIFGLASLPASGGIPEASRYNWDMMVGTNQIQLTGGFTEYLRGICNPLYSPMICPPPRDPGSAPFFLRTGVCTVGGPCEEVGITHATFDAASATITVPVPMAMIKAKPGTKITPAASSMGPSIYAAPAAMVSHASLPNDTLTITKTYTVPR